MTIADRFANLSPLKRALLALDEMKVRLDAAERQQREPIAIIGLGCRIPGGESPDRFWELLRDGRSVVREVPADRWDVDAYYDPDPDAPGKMSTRAGAFLDRVDLFDPQFFGIAPREAVSMDPQQRLLLEVCWEALEHAGIAADKLSGSKTGVFVGIAASDYTDLVKAGDVTRIDSHLASGAAHSIASGRLSYLLGLQGPAISIDTACSSSLVAVHLACQSLNTGDSRMAIAGGVNVIVTPDNGIAFSKSRMLAPDGRCKTFDADADGFGRGEGCGVIVLKRLSDAKADGDRILAVIPGSAINQDGPSSGLTAPNGPAQEAVIREALSRAGLDPRDVDLIEAHGTGTSLGDPIEVQALGEVFGPREPGRHLLVGSVKTNVGHLEAAAGIAGLIKLVLSLQHDTIPPHLNLRRLNPLVEWDDLPIDIPTTARPWPRGERKRVAGVSSFGFSGTNAHILVAEAPDALAPVAAIERPQHLLTVSARSQDALRARAGDLHQVLHDDRSASIADVAFTANAGRAQMPHRLAVRGASRQEISDRLRQFVDGSPAEGVHTGALDRSDTPRVAFLFTGQGAQYIGMGRTLYETQPAFRHALDECDTRLRPHLDRSLLSILYPAPGDMSPIDETAYTQPALFAVDYAIAELWRSWGIQPAAVMGHSLGEYVAACIAGVLTLDDALMLVAARGRLMQALPADGQMASVFADDGRVAAAIAPFAAAISIAAINEPAHTVISGKRDAVSTVLQRLSAEGVSSKPLVVSHAFHSPLMTPMLDDFTALLQRVTWSAPRIPLVSNVTGASVSAADVMSPTYWRQHILAPVQFVRSIDALRGLGVTLFVECGPHVTLLGMAAKCVAEGRAEWIPSLRKGQDDWTQMLDSLSRLFVRGVRVDWSGFEKGFTRSKVALPTYPFERERYWISAPASRRMAHDAIGQPLHPFLARRLRVAESQATVYETLVTHDTFGWVFDHKVHGTVIMPGAGFIEMGFAAASSRWGDGRHRVENLVIHQPLVIDPDRATTLQIVISGSDERRATFKVFTVPADEQSTDWPIHAEGTLERADAMAPSADAADFESLRARCGHAIAPEALYEDLHDRGLALGPAFQGLRAIRTGANEACASVELPAGAADNSYCVHPVLIDLGIQTLGAALMSAANASRLSYVPQAIERAQHNPDAGAVAWAHAVPRDGWSIEQDTIVADIFLRDADGTLVASIEGLRVKRADRDALRRGRAASTRDWLYEVQWHEQSRPSDGTAWIPSLATVADTVTARVTTVAAEHRFDVLDQALSQLEALSTAYVVEALTGLGVSMAPGTNIATKGLGERLGVVPSQRRLLERLCGILCESGVLRATEDGWRVERAPDRPDTAAWLTAIESRFGDVLQAELALLGQCAPNLAGVLKGTTDPLSLLFPGGSSELAENLYQVSPAARGFNQLLADALTQVLAASPVDQGLRVLEIGGGTGSTSSFVLPRLSSKVTEYVFTDVSPAFTTRAERKFAQYQFVRCQPLDIERNPAAQGFDDSRFDIIVAANVLHATRDLSETFSHVKQLLAPGGLLIMLEMVRPQRWIDLTFGLTDGWWRFTDLVRRPSYPLLDHAGWKQFLADAGFTDVAAIPGDSHGTGVLGVESTILARGPASTARSAARLIVGGATARRLASELEAAGDRCQVVADGDEKSIVHALTQSGTIGSVVHVSALDRPANAADTLDALRTFEEQCCGGALNLVKRLAGAGISVPLTLVTRGAQAVQPGSAVDPLQAPLWGFGGVVTLEHPELQCRRVDLDPADDSLMQLVSELRVDRQAAGTLENQVALRANGRYVARLAPRAATTATTRPDSYRLEIPVRGTLDGLRLVPAARRLPAPGEVELRVHATALNFRDVMNALGVYPGDPGPLGGECAGTVTAVGQGVSHLHVGDEVIAVAAGSFASYVTTPASLVVQRPSTLDAEEAVTIPIAYVTAAFALQHLARISAGDRVLVHAAAGGVGLAAVHLAMRAGAEVFATAGSPEKRAYLTSIGVPHVMSSRTLDFADEIRAKTGGRGVDVVLNSLSGEFIARSFDAIASEGRFLEIGKSGWTQDRVVALGRNIQFHVIDWSVDARENPALIRSILTNVVDAAARGELPPLPRRTFAIDAAVDAFRFMAQARHTGKVVVTHPEKDAAALVRSDGSYLITGGLRGLGLLTAEWLADRGAQRLILLGRSEPSSEAQRTIEQLEQRGVRVAAVIGDVARGEVIAEALSHAGGAHPPLRGVVHSAGVLDDGAITQLDWRRFETVLAPKMFGAWHLDRATREMPLDFFVMFSSVASVFGSRGQANHASANAYLDQLAHVRRSEGHAALSINWGVWSEIGAAVRHGVDRRASSQGIGMIDPARGLSVLEQLMRERATQVTVLPVDWARYAEQAGDLPATLLSTVLPRDGRQRRREKQSAGQVETPALVQQLERTPADGRLRVIQTHVRELATRVLALPPSRPIDLRQPLNELGLDSLLAVELRNALSVSLGRPLPATLLFDYPSVETLSEFVGREVLGLAREEAPVTPAAPTAAHVVDRIEELSDEEVDRLLANRMARKQEA